MTKCYFHNNSYRLDNSINPLKWFFNANILVSTIGIAAYPRITFLPRLDFCNCSSRLGCILVVHF